MDEQLIIRLAVSMKSGLHCSRRISLEKHMAANAREPAGEDLSRAVSALHLLSGMQARFIHLHDEDYPPLLREVYDPPYLLAVIGALPPPDLPSVSVLGPGRPSTGALISAWAFGLESGYARMSVVSPCTGAWADALMKGLRAGGGCLTRALSGTPGDLASLAGRDEIEEGGGIILEITGDDPAREKRSLRLVYGLSRGLLLLEACSGSMLVAAADDALDQGRDVLVHRKGTYSPWGSGTRRLHESGAPAVSRLGDILKLWGYDAQSTPRVRFRRSGKGGPPQHALRICINGLEGWLERIQ